MKGYSSRKPRVCLISHAYLEKQYRGKLTLIGQAVDLTVISPEQFLYPYGLFRADFTDAQGYNVRIYPCRFPLPVRTSTRFILASRDLGFRREPPDIIHVENEESSFLLMEALLYRRWYAPKAKIIVFVWANQPLRGLKGAVQKILVRWARPQVDFYIAGNSEGKELLVQSGVGMEQVAICPQMGVDVDYFAPAIDGERESLRNEFGIPQNHFVIGFVGRCCADKGIPDLLDAFQQLHSSMGEKVHLLCVGDGPLKSDLLTRQPGVKVVTPGGSGAVLPYYRVMDVLVLPSRTMPYWKEQFGRVLIEAMACGIPVIGSNSGEIPNVIGSTGMIFPEGDVTFLLNQLRILMSNPHLKSACEFNGRERIIEIYSDKRIYEQTLQIYSRLSEGEFFSTRRVRREQEKNC